MRQENRFKIVANWGQARAGVLETYHGQVKTPVFMPVGTQATVKSISPKEAAEAGSQIILANTYHLMLRPGASVIEKMGGLHRFMRWNKPILTDSGGFQVSSLGLFKPDREIKLAKITEEGVEFCSHLDGSKHFMTPNSSIEIQERLGADIIMAFDEATPETGKKYAFEAMKRTHRWLDRSVLTWKELEEVKTKHGLENYQELFGIIQGGNFKDLRIQSAEYVLQSGVDGIALGGATIGQSIAQTAENASWVRELVLETGKPIYFMGVGVSPSHAIGAVFAGADMFDCVAPTKLARCGLLYCGKIVISGGDPAKTLFVSPYPKERLDIGKKEFEADEAVIDADCDCATCKEGFSRAYLHHLFKARELLYYRLASIHNIRMMVRVVEQLREAICQGKR